MDWRVAPALASRGPQLLTLGLCRALPSEEARLEEEEFLLSACPLCIDSPALALAPWPPLSPSRPPEGATEPRPALAALPPGLGMPLPRAREELSFLALPVPLLPLGREELFFSSGADVVESAFSSLRCCWSGVEVRPKELSEALSFSLDRALSLSLSLSLSESLLRALFLGVRARLRVRWAMPLSAILGLASALRLTGLWCPSAASSPCWLPQALPGVPGREASGSGAPC